MSSSSIKFGTYDGFVPDAQDERALLLAKDVYQEVCHVMDDEPGRHYHTMAHIEHMLDELRGTGIFSENPHGVDLRGMVLAIYFHDIVQDSPHGDNEELSARFMRRILAGAAEAAETAGTTNAVCDANIEVAERLIMATKHDGRELGHFDEQLIHDLDLAILGAQPEAFALYEQQIRREYARFSDADYRQGRVLVLETLDAHTPIFQTPHFHEKYEKQAHVNLTNLICELSKKPPVPLDSVAN
jgi:predicted metal-dependent HD superfamily phosphohydrolase